MKMPRFTLRDMFLATTLIAVGIAIAVASIRAHDFDLISPLASAAFIGAGIGTPFHRKQLGVALGLLTVIVLFVGGMVWMFFSFRHSRW